MQAIRLTTTVLPGHKIEVTDPGLKVGDVVEVIVFPGAVVPADSPAPEMRPSVFDIIRSLNGHRHSQTAQEVDDYINAERDSWER